MLDQSLRDAAFRSSAHVRSISGSGIESLIVYGLATLANEYRMRLRRGSSIAPCASAISSAMQAPATWADLLVISLPTTTPTVEAPAKETAMSMHCSKLAGGRSVCRTHFSAFAYDALNKVRAPTTLLMTLLSRVILADLARKGASSAELMQGFWILRTASP